MSVARTWSAHAPGAVRMPQARKVSSLHRRTQPASAAHADIPNQRWLRRDRRRDRGAHPTGVADSGTGLTFSTHRAGAPWARVETPLQLRVQGDVPMRATAAVVIASAALYMSVVRTGAAAGMISHHRQARATWPVTSWAWRKTASLCLILRCCCYSLMESCSHGGDLDVDDLRQFFSSPDLLRAELDGGRHYVRPASPPVCAPTHPRSERAPSKPSRSVISLRATPAGRRPATG
jgi:hypothetical protein